MEILRGLGGAGGGAGSAKDAWGVALSKDLSVKCDGHWCSNAMCMVRMRGASGRWLRWWYEVEVQVVAGVAFVYGAARAKVALASLRNWRT